MSVKIYQLETTNFCNARCDYCPHDKMTRPRGFVSQATVHKVIRHCQAVGQEYIALHHMGEPILHPLFPEIIKSFYKAGIRTEFSTNGILLNMGQAIPILDAGISRIRVAVDFAYNRPGYIEQIKQFLSIAQNFETVIE